MDLIGKIKKTLKAKPAPTYQQDGLTTVHNNGFMWDSDFASAECAGAATGSWAKSIGGVHVILWAAYQCASVEGYFVECGTNKGGFSRTIVDYIDFTSINKDFYLLDTFEGLVDDLLTEDEKRLAKKNISKMCIQIVMMK